MRTILSLLAIATVAAIPLTGWQSSLSAQVIEPAPEPNGPSLDASISGDGQVVAFTSYADNLVPNDTNGTWDVFVRDLQTGETRQVSVSSAGIGGNAASMAPAISQDGQFVAFQSRADNLVPDDTNGLWDIFVHDLLTGETERVSVTSAGEQWEDSSLEPSISGDGQFVAFESWVETSSIFVHDRLTGETTNVSLTSSEAPFEPPCMGASISADGSAVAFFCYSFQTGPFSGWQVRAYDMETGVTSIVSTPTGETGVQLRANTPSVSADGSLIAFESNSADLVPDDIDGRNNDIFVRNLADSETDMVSVASGGDQVGGHSHTAAINGDGRFVAFHSQSPLFSVDDLNGTWDILVHDRVTGETKVVSLDDTTHSGNNASIRPSLNADGRYVAFASKATDLTAGSDSNGTWDIFVRDLQTGETTLVSVPGS